ncbi:hypothetical protein L7F22_051371 [Adiantum nelumboides]|nr:hypothetical protein [Adiantum nelumboides]
MKRVYESVRTLGESHLQVSRDTLLMPVCMNVRLKQSREQQTIFSQYAPRTSEPSKLYRCSNKERVSKYAVVYHMTDHICPWCLRSLISEEVSVSHISPAFLKPQQSFLISDSLSIEPNSANNSLQLLAHHNIHHLSDLCSVDCSISRLEVVLMLTLAKASFSPSPSVLNEVFAAKVSSAVLNEVFAAKVSSGDSQALVGKYVSAKSALTFLPFMKPKMFLPRRRRKKRKNNFKISKKLE